MKNYPKRFLLVTIGLLLSAYSAKSQVLDKQKMLDRFDFWQNKDWDWYKSNIPFFESPDSEIDKTYYYRWEMMSAHLIYGSVQTGYSSTEFIDRPWWSGRYGAISCPAGHQLYEFRWFKDKRFVQDYAAYWFRTPGAQPRNYSNWMADAIWQAYKVNRDADFVMGLKQDLIDNFRGWEKEHWVDREGMFAWDGMHDGMETNINSRQTKDWFAGSPGYRPTLNSYMWADAMAIMHIANLGGDANTRRIFQEKAQTIKRNFLEKCWDPERNFFFHRFQNDEQGGIKANTLTYQTGKYAGNKHGREQMGFVPWYFRMPDPGFESAWQYLMDPAYFFSPFGPTTVEKGDPLYNVAKNCCAWSGNAWPFATSQTLKAMANVLKYYRQDFISKEDYFKQLRIFATTHRKDDKPYIAEANHPETGSWDGHDVTGHSEHYFHSAFVDELITGLVGLEPKETDSIEINPLIPDHWNYFALDDVSYHGRKISVIWDRTGTKYHKGKGLMILAEGKVIARSPLVRKLSAALTHIDQPKNILAVNYAVNNEQGQYFPRAITSFAGIGNDVSWKINDGQYWYYTSTTNRWSSLYSASETQWCGIDFGALRPISTVKLYFVQDAGISVPKNYELEYWNIDHWSKVPKPRKSLLKPQGNRANTIEFEQISTAKLRVTMQLEKGMAVALSEFEAWGPPKADLKVPAETDNGNLAHVKRAKVSASYTSRFDQLGFINDGLLNPNARWTAFESPSKSDWVVFDFNTPQQVNTANLYFFSDRAGVQAPFDYQLLYWKDDRWLPVEDLEKKPVKPIANLNLVTFKTVQTQKIKIVLTHLREKVFSGLYELELYHQ